MKLGPYDLDTLYHGDALAMVRDVPDQSVDFILFDPDYGVGMDYGNGEVSRDEAIAFVEDMVAVLKPKSRSGQAIMFWSGSTERVKALLMSAVDDLWPLRYMGIWYKPNGAGPSGNGWARRFETWFWLSDAPKSRTLGEWSSLPDVLQHNRVTRRHPEAVAHPSQKPVDLLERFIRMFTQPGGVVLDPVMGSGSTAVACRRTARHFIGFELNVSYVAMAHQRLAHTPVPLFTLEPEQLELALPLTEEAAD